MRKNRLLTTVVAALVAVGSLGTLAGCGTANAKESNNGVKTVKFVLESQDPPYSYADKNGNPAGFDLAVLRAIDKNSTTTSLNIASSTTRPHWLEPNKADMTP